MRTLHENTRFSCLFVQRRLNKMHVWVLMMESKVGKRGGRRERDEAQSKGCSVGDIIEAYIRQ